jgi:hypothetical protein
MLNVLCCFAPVVSVVVRRVRCAPKLFTLYLVPCTLYLKTKSRFNQETAFHFINYFLVQLYSRNTAGSAGLDIADHTGTFISYITGAARMGR